MTPEEQLNRLISDEFGLPWHTVKSIGTLAQHASLLFYSEPPECSCGKQFDTDRELYDHISNSNPVFTDDSGPARLLREFQKRPELWFRFVMWVGWDWTSVEFNTTVDEGESSWTIEAVICSTARVPSNFITERGLMAKTFGQWMWVKEQPS